MQLNSLGTNAAIFNVRAMLDCTDPTLGHCIDAKQLSDRHGDELRHKGCRRRWGTAPLRCQEKQSLTEGGSHHSMFAVYLLSS